MVYNLVFIMKMTVYTIWLVWLKGARQRHFILWLGFRVDVVNLKHSWYLYSKNQSSPKPIIYVDIWIYKFLLNRDSDYSSRATGQPGITALSRITADD